MNWNDSRNIQETLVILGTLSGECAKLGGPVTQHLNQLVQSSRYAELLAFVIDYSTIETNDAVYSRQIQGFFQKLEDLNLGIDKEVAAANRFLESERSCLEVNRTLVYHRRKPEKRPERVDVVLHYASRKIHDILDSNPPELSAFQPTFGPGANTSVKGAVACPRAKLSAPLECSWNTLPLASELLSEVPRWTSLHSCSETEKSWITDLLMSHGKLTFVPKNAKTHRSIVIEPVLNSFFQKGVGSYMKDRLMRSGVNLYDQTLNQIKACRGSCDNSLATIDLSMASDCLASELVHELLPPAWTDLLIYLKTDFVWLPDSVTPSMREKHGLSQDTWNPLTDERVTDLLKLEKFSSMGNGFTFELESLIFYSLVYGTCRSMHVPVKDISVYGDDLIVPRAAVSRLIEVLSYCGFSVNSDKSYSDGPFRESCGADYLNGFDIRPFYQKSLISDRTLYSMHNWFIRHGEYQLAAATELFCNPDLILRGPDGYGDGHLIGDYQLRYTRATKRAGWGGGFFDTYALRARRFTKPLPGDAELPSYSVYTRSGESSPTDPDVVRGSKGYAKISIYTLVTSVFQEALKRSQGSRF